MGNQEVRLVAPRFNLQQYGEGALYGILQAGYLDPADGSEAEGPTLREGPD